MTLDQSDLVRFRLRTFDTLDLRAHELGPSIDDVQALPWVAAGVARVRETRLGYQIAVGPYAGRLVIPDVLTIDIDELVPGTAATCIPLSETGRRFGEQVTSTGTQVPPDVAIANRFTAECVRSLRRGPSKQYSRRVFETSRPRGKILIRETAVGPRRHGRTQLVCQSRVLTDDTPLNRILLAAARRGEYLLVARGGERSTLRDLRTCIQALAGASARESPQDWMDVEMDDQHRAVVAMARLLLEGVPAIPRDADPTRAFSSWVNLERMFEEAVRTILGDCFPPGVVRRGVDDSVSIWKRSPGDPVSTAKQAEPDAVIRNSDVVIVVDAKYRRSGEHPSDEQIYQLLAHSVAFGAQAAALVTPALSSAPGVHRLGRDATGCTVDVVSVNPASASSMRSGVANWARETLARIELERSRSPLTVTHLP